MPVTARDLCLKQLADSEFQLSKAIEDLDSEAAEIRANPAGMTIREQVAHLGEAAVATLAAVEGRKYEWGSWQPEDRSWDGVKRAWRAARQAAIAAMPEADDALWHAHEYLIAHDYYHVGQICSARIALQPNWDSYAIYRH